jgi:hypothetical protein
MELIPILLLCAAVAYFGWKIYSGYRQGPDARPSKQGRSEGTTRQEAGSRPRQQQADERPYTLRRDADAKPQQRQASAGAQLMASAHHWDNDGYRDVAIVGESNYQHHLKQVVGTPDDNGVAVSCVAFLIPEPTNQYDANAVRIDINGGTVGYLSKSDAVKFHRRLKREELTGAITSCPAMIFGGKQASGARTPYGVWLEMHRL